jgi:hypothetical protein
VRLGADAFRALARPLPSVLTLPLPPRPWQFAHKFSTKHAGTDCNSRNYELGMLSLLCRRKSE